MPLCLEGRHQLLPVTRLVARHSQHPYSPPELPGTPTAPEAHLFFSRGNALFHLCSHMIQPVTKLVLASAHPTITNQSSNILLLLTLSIRPLPRRHLLTMPARLTLLSGHRRLHRRRKRRHKLRDLRVSTGKQVLQSLIPHPYAPDTPAAAQHSCASHTDTSDNEALHRP